jgi:hypothetical protein
MQHKNIIPQTYSNLNQLILILEKQHIDKHFIESIKIAQKALLSLELMGIASNYYKNESKLNHLNIEL